MAFIMFKFVTTEMFQMVNLREKTVLFRISEASFGTGKRLTYVNQVFELSIFYIYNDDNN